ncbi:MAG: lasso peptide biosynthesis B2 protein [Myxococcota bacterium]|nr:lasso peptide biosynthesis B2 protein [Myxococcota bacterium]
MSDQVRPAVLAWLRPLLRTRLGRRGAYLAVRAALRGWFDRMPLDRLLEHLDDRGAAGAPLAPFDEVVEDIARAETMARRLRLRPESCLYRALARFALLRATGHDVRFAIAIGRSAPEVAAHAGVEHEGRPLLEPPPRWAATFRWPRSERD